MEINANLQPGGLRLKDIKENFLKDDLHCCYCGKYIYSLGIKPTKEHLVPKSKGGNSTYYNKRACCNKCNTWRGNKPLENWLIEVKNKINSNHFLNGYTKYDLEIILENIQYINIYVTSAKEKLYKKRLDGTIMNTKC